MSISRTISVLFVVISILLSGQCKDSSTDVKSAFGAVSLQSLGNGKDFPVLKSVADWFREEQVENQAKLSFKDFVTPVKNGHKFNLDVLRAYIDSQLERVDSLRQSRESGMWSEVEAILTIEYEELIDIALILSLKDEDFQKFEPQTDDHLVILLYNLRKEKPKHFMKIAADFKTRKKVSSTITDKKLNDLDRYREYLFQEKNNIMTLMMSRYQKNEKLFIDDLKVTETELKKCMTFFNAIETGGNVKDYPGKLPQRLIVLIKLANEIKDLGDWTTSKIKLDFDSDEGNEDDDLSIYDEDILVSDKFDSKLYDASPVVVPIYAGFKNGPRIKVPNGKILSLDETRKFVIENLQSGLLRGLDLGSGGRIGTRELRKLRILRKEHGMPTLKIGDPYNPAKDDIRQYEILFLKKQVKILSRYEFPKPSPPTKVQKSRSATSKAAKTAARNKSVSWILKKGYIRQCYDRKSCGLRYYGAGRKKKRLHAGIDLIAPYGTKVYAPKPGRIIRYNGFLQKTVYIGIKHEDGSVLRLCELDAKLAIDPKTKERLRVGSFIKGGQHVGKVGNLRGSDMVHVELYKRASSAVKKGKFGGPARFYRSIALSNPTSYIRCLQGRFYDKTHKDDCDVHLKK